MGPELGDGKSLVLRVNPHSIDNGRPKEYYEALKNGELKGFGWNEKENSYIFQPYDSSGNPLVGVRKKPAAMGWKKSCCFRR